MKTSKVVLLFFLVMLVGFVSTAVIKKCTGPEEPLSPAPGQNTEEVVTADTLALPYTPTPPPVVKPDISSVTGTPKLVVGKTKYYYTLTLKGLPVGDYEYKLYDSLDSYSVTDGKFSQIAPNESGKYKLIAIDKYTGERSEPKTISGFVTKTPIDKMTASEINNAVATGDYDNYANVILSKCHNKKCEVKSGGQKTTLANIFTEVLLGTSRTVRNIEYNCLGYITSIEFN